MLDGYKNAREGRFWTRGGARQEKQCRFWGGMLRMWNVGVLDVGVLDVGVLDVECWMWNVGCWMWHVRC